MDYIHRQIEKIMRHLLSTFPSIVITGPRQSGKSTLLLQTLKDYKYFTLDDPLIREQILNDPVFFLDTAGEKIVLDEIQLAPEILSHIKIKIDKNRDDRGQFVFTGSQQFHLMKNLTESLAGRIALLDLLPFSISEIKKAINLEHTLEYFTTSCLRGAFPELIMNSLLDSQIWFSSYIDTYMTRDVRNLYNIGNLRDFQRFLQLLAGRCSQILNLTQFSNDLGISVPTVRSWLSVLEACRIIYFLPSYHTNFGKRIVKSPKVYFLDAGLVCYLTGIKDQDHLLKGPMAGSLFENFCIQEIIKLFLHSGRKTRLYYLRTNKNLEIDLIIEESYNLLLPVEIKMTKTPNLGMTSNIQKFKKLFPALKINKSIILTMTDVSRELARDIFLLTFDEFLAQIYDIVISGK